MGKYKPGDRVLIPAEIYVVNEYYNGRVEYTVIPMNCEPNENDYIIFDYAERNIIGKWEEHATKEEA